MDAVAQHGLFTQQTVVEQAVHRPGAVVCRGIVDVVQALGHVDVEAGAAVVFLHHGVQRGVGQGEQGVAAEHGGEHGVFFFLAAADEIAVFADGRVPLLCAVPVRHLVAEAGAHAQLLYGFGDGVKGPFDPAVARVMVEHGGAAGADAVDEGGVGGAEGAFLVQSAVDGPPHAFQYLQKVRGIVALDGQAPGQGAVDVGMDVDEGGHDESAPGVDEFRLRIFLFERRVFAHLKDALAFCRHRAQLEIGPFRVAADQPPVAAKIHKDALPSAYIYP